MSTNLFHLYSLIQEIECLRHSIDAYKPKNKLIGRLIAGVMIINGRPAYGYEEDYLNINCRNNSMHFLIGAVVEELTKIILNDLKIPKSEFHKEFKDLDNIGVRIRHNVIKYGEISTNTDDEIKVLKKYYSFIKSKIKTQ